jgi:hypothetical protein
VISSGGVSRRLGGLVHPEITRPSNFHYLRDTTPVETKMHCVKLLGQRLMARDFDRQVAEFQVRLAVLNGFTALGIPVTEAVG